VALLKERCSAAGARRREQQRCQDSLGGEVLHSQQRMWQCSCPVRRQFRQGDRLDEGGQDSELQIAEISIQIIENHSIECCSYFQGPYLERAGSQQRKICMLMQLAWHQNDSYFLKRAQGLL
jgi:hypothetical protein